MKKCVVCGGRVLGRTDKKYCSPKCVWTFHNDKRAKRILSSALSDEELEEIQEMVKAWNTDSGIVVRRSQKKNAASVTS